MKDMVDVITFAVISAILAIVLVVLFSWLIFGVTLTADWILFLVETK